MSNIIQNVIVVLGLGLIGVVGWYMYTENGRLTLDTSSSVELEGEIQAFIQKQNTLRQINIDTTILNDQNFARLETVTQPVPAQERGRENPFLLGED
jgi:hypothetical protein